MQHRQARPAPLQVSLPFPSSRASSPRGWGGPVAAPLWDRERWQGRRAAGRPLPPQKKVPEHVAMAARGLRARALRARVQAASCGVSDGGHRAVAAMRLLAAGYLECPVGEGRAAGPLQHARGLTPLLTSWKLGHLPRPSGKTFLFSPVSKCTFFPPTEAGWAKTEEQPEARTPGFKCDVLRLNSFPKVVLWRALWQPSQNNQ